MLFTSPQKTKRNNVKNTLLLFVIPAIILYRKVAGLIMQGLKKFWNNWQWALTLVALLYAIFLFYYQSTISTPARLDKCEAKLQEHITKSDERFNKIETNQHNVEIALAELKIMVKDVIEDLKIIKTHIVEQ